MKKELIKVFYSKEDEGYIAHLFDMPSMSAFGTSEEEAIRELGNAVGGWLEYLKKESKEEYEEYRIYRHLHHAHVQR